MDHFFVVTNNQKDPELAVTRHIQDYLEKHGKFCQMAISEDGNGMEPPKEAECIIVLGGDGTLLRTARKMVARDIPLIGVNLGTLGYLAEVESGNLDQALDLLMKDEFTREKRMMLSGTTADMKDYALNDIAITRKGDLQVNTIHLYVMIGCKSDVLYLLPVNRLLRPHEGVVSPCLHFHKYKRVIRNCNDINILMPISPISLQYGISLLRKIMYSEIFSPFTEIIMLCHMRILKY